MGRSLPPATQLILDQIAETMPLYRALRRGDQFILDEFFNSVQQHRAAIANAASLLPLEALLLLVQLEERKVFQGQLNDLYEQIRGLRAELQALRDASR